MLIGDAVDTLRLLCAAAEEPTLDDGELTRVLARARRVDAAGTGPANVTTTADWTAATVVTVGTVVQQPGVRRWWVAENSGTTGATAPTWPTFTTQPASDVYVVDGTVVWEDAGPEWHPTYDLNTAAAECWAVKAGRAAAKFSFTTDGQSFQRQQIAARCLEMAAYYRRRRGLAVVELERC